ncbi:DUF465 domain-containing protein [Nostoc ellipsosporum NOK]|nr:DUF465 domain-containing protein [Nostoc ellipsosporum NOK]
MQGDPATGAFAMDEKEIVRRLEAVRTEHRDLDAAIDALLATGTSDQLQIARLKKRKLMLRDEIALLEDQLIPDIIA